MKQYHTYIVNFNDTSENDNFDYFIFHSKTSPGGEGQYQKKVKEFKKLFKKDRGYSFEGEPYDIFNIIEYKAKNYPKAN